MAETAAGYITAKLPALIGSGKRFADSKMYQAVSAKMAQDFEEEPAGLFTEPQAAYTERQIVLFGGLLNLEYMELLKLNNLAYKENRRVFEKEETKSDVGLSDAKLWVNRAIQDYTQNPELFQKPKAVLPPVAPLVAIKPAPPPRPVPDREQIAPPPPPVVKEKPHKATQPVATAKTEIPVENKIEASPPIAPTAMVAATTAKTVQPSAAASVELSHPDVKSSNGEYTAGAKPVVSPHPHTKSPGEYKVGGNPAKASVTHTSVALSYIIPDEYLSELTKNQREIANRLKEKIGIYLDINRTLVEVGDLAHNPKLQRALEKIARQIQLETKARKQQAQPENAPATDHVTRLGVRDAPRDQGK